MKAVVLVPPLRDFYFTHHRFAALGARTVVCVLEKAGVETTFLNFPLQASRGRQVCLPRELVYLQPYLLEGETGKLSYFNRFQHFGPSFTDAARLVVAQKPQVVFLSCFAFAYARDAIEQAAAIKKLLPAVPLIAGGAGVSVYPEYFLQGLGIDFAFRGEVERALPLLVAALQHKPPDLRTIPQLYRREDKQIVTPVNKLPPAAGELIFISGLTRETPDTLYLSTSLSRGCPGKCRFCVNATSGEFKVLPFSRLKEVIREFFLLKKKKKKRLRVNFEDDNLLYYKKDFFRILEEFRKHFPCFTFFTENGIDYTRLDEETTTRLLDYGLGQFNLSLGTLESHLQRQENRPALLQRYTAVLKRAAARGISCITYFICGFRNETLPGVARTLLFLARQQTFLGISLFYAIPGLPDFKNPKHFSHRHPALCLGASAYPWNRSLTTAQLITAFRLSRLVNLAKQPSHTEEEWRLLELCYRDRVLYTIVKQKKERRIVKVPHMDEDLMEMVLGEYAD